jgi:hypothetical protein
MPACEALAKGMVERESVDCALRQAQIFEFWQPSC